jgi:hypothetical protein
MQERQLSSDESEEDRRMSAEDLTAWVHLMRDQRGWTKAHCAGALGTSPNQIRCWMDRPVPRHIGLAITAVMLGYAQPWVAPGSTA